MCTWLWSIPLYLLMGHQHSLHPVIPGYHLFHFLQGSCQDFNLQPASSRNVAALSTQALELSVETLSLFSVSHNNFNCVLIFFHFGLMGLVSPSRACIYYLQEQTPNVLGLNTEGLLSPHVCFGARDVPCQRVDVSRSPVTSAFATSSITGWNLLNIPFCYSSCWTAAGRFLVSL